MNHLWHARGRFAESRAKYTGLARASACSRNPFTSQDGSSGTGCRKPLAGPVVNDLEITNGMRLHHDMVGADSRYAGCKMAADRRVQIDLQFWYGRNGISSAYLNRSSRLCRPHQSNAKHERGDAQDSRHRWRPDWPARLLLSLGSTTWLGPEMSTRYWWAESQCAYCSEDRTLSDKQADLE